MLNKILIIFLFLFSSCASFNGEFYYSGPKSVSFIDYEIRCSSVYFYNFTLLNQDCKQYIKIVNIYDFGMYAGFDCGMYEFSNGLLNSYTLRYLYLNMPRIRRYEPYCIDFTFSFNFK